MARHTNKVHVIEHDGLKHPAAMIGEGMTALVDKFLSRASKAMIVEMGGREREDFEQFDIEEFAERICEPMVSILFRQYVLDRYEFVGRRIGEFGLSMIIAGATHIGELRAFFVHGDGLAEAFRIVAL